METKEDVLAFVGRHLPALNIVGDPQTLPGGLMNQVWKVQATPNPVVVKYAPPYIASAPSIDFDASRIIFEARALEAFEEDGPFSQLSSTAIRPPRLIARDDEAHALILEDIGEGVDLAVWLSHAESSDFLFAFLLGQFIGSLHRDSLNKKAFYAEFDNHSIQQTRQRVQYDAIGSLCEEAELADAAELGKQARDLGIRLLEPGHCLIMGDLWPPSIQVTPRGIRIIDWEFVHFGNPAQDIAHLAAHLWMLQHRVPERKKTISGFWEHCIQSYTRATQSVIEALWPARYLADASIHFGSEIMVRTIGPFQQGYLYDGLSPEDDILNEAIQHAALHLRRPESIKNISQLFSVRP